MYFERFLNGKVPRIRFNVPNVGEYVIQNNAEVTKITPIKIPSLNIQMPPYERDRVKDLVIVDNPSLKGTPARIFTMDGVIEKGRDIYSYPKPMRVFFLLHETAHLFYKTEKFCDLFALSHFLEMGYNMSTAMYCLTNVLKRNPQNVERVKFIYNNIMRNGS